MAFFLKFTFTRHISTDAWAVWIALAILIPEITFGQAQPSSPSNQPKLLSASFEELAARWSNAAPAQLLKAAEAGDPEAQYYYGVREWDQAFEDTLRVSAFLAQTKSSKSFSDAEATAATETWESA